MPCAKSQDLRDRVIALRDAGRSTAAVAALMGVSRFCELVVHLPVASALVFHARLGVDCSVSAVDDALRRLGLTYKKRRSTPPSKTGPTSPRNASGGSGTPRTATRGG